MYSNTDLEKDVAELREKDIIFVSNSLANGGSERVLCLLANHFSERGRNVGVISFNSNKNEYYLNSNIEKLYIPHSVGLFEKIVRVKILRKIAKENPYATIVAFEYFVNMLTIFSCLLLPNRVVVSERNDPSLVGNGVVKGRIREFLYRKVDMLVCQTATAAEFFPDAIPKQVIQNPIKDHLPLPFEGKRRLTITTFCRLEKQKNLGMLIRAFASFRKAHPDYTLEIYGNGSERQALLTLVESLSLNEVVTLEPSKADIHEIVRDCSMFVLPSDFEGLSNSMLEAMAVGLPTISTDTPSGGARSVITNGINGLLVPVNDEEKLLHAMLRVAADDNAAELMGKNAAEVREQLSLSRVAIQWERAVQMKVKG